MSSSGNKAGECRRDTPKQDSESELLQVPEVIQIVYEDDDLIVINKPTGLLVHPDGRTKEPSVVAWFIERCPSARSVGEPLVLQDGTEIERPGVVHRLDRETSGVLILAKTHEAFVHLKKQFQERHARKEYRAFVWGEMKNDRGVIDRPIGRSRRDPRLRSAQRGARGTLREAVTNYEVIKRDGGFTYLSAEPKTGRTHQLRAHFKAVNHPIVCDALYGPKQESDDMKRGEGCALGFTRLALHAYRLELTLPSGHQSTFEARPPEEFVEAIDRIYGKG